MRYIITPTQLHNLIYRFLGDMFTKRDFRKEVNPYVSDGNTWHIDMFDDKGKRLISYYWYGPGVDDDDQEHHGTGSLLVHPSIVDKLRSNLGIRESRVLDVIADWVSETLESDIDEIDIYPQRDKRPVY